MVYFRHGVWHPEARPASGARPLLFIARIEREYARRFLLGLSARMRRWEDRPMEILDPSGPVPEALLADAGVIVATVTSRRLARRLLPHRAKVLNLSSSSFGQGFATVSSDGWRHGAAAAAHLIAQGARHLAIFDPRGDYPHKAGFIAGAAERRVPAVRLSRTAQVREWIRATPKPSGLFALDNWQAVSVLNLALSEGIEVPDHLLVVGGEGDALPSGLARRGLTYIPPPYEAICERACEKLYAFLHRGRRLTASSETFPPLPVVMDQSTDYVEAGDPAVRRAIAFIRERASQALDVDTVARHAGLPRRALERRFHAFHTRSIHEEILRNRIARARFLLTTTEWTAGRIAYECGFASQAHFGKVFHAAEGRTPIAFRRRAGG